MNKNSGSTMLVIVGLIATVAITAVIVVSNVDSAKENLATNIEITDKIKRHYGSMTQARESDKIEGIKKELLFVEDSLEYNKGLSEKERKNRLSEYSDESLKAKIAELKAQLNLERVLAKKSP